MRKATISYRFYNNYEGSDRTLYVVEVEEGKFMLKIFSSLVNLEDAMQQAEAWRKLYEDGLIDDADLF